MRNRSLAALTFLALQAAAAPAMAAGGWVAERVEKPTVPAQIVAQPLVAAPSDIADMLTAVGPEAGGIVRAWYSQPTNRYPHRALGDTTEGGALVVERADGREFTYRLGEIEVFEDLYPRIADLDGDGAAEVVTIRSSLVAGASLTIYGLNGDTLVEKAATPFIGQPFRWLNIAAIDHFLGLGTREIAFVVTPHIGGKLGFVHYEGGRLTVVAAQPGFSNHVNHTTELRLAAAADVDGDGRVDLALPSQDRKRLRIMALKRDGLAEIGSADLPSPIDKAIAVSGSGEQAVFTVGLENGSVYEIRRQAN